MLVSEVSTKIGYMSKNNFYRPKEMLKELKVYEYLLLQL
jgi:hypothetical protein